MKIRPVIYRIQQKALDLASHEFEDAGIGGIARFNELFAEKFAELIIEECCVALKPILRDMISRGQGADIIKQHFGIE